jgi:hypothetical protein
MSRVDLECAHAAGGEAETVARRLVAELVGPEPVLCFAFASPERDHRALAKALRAALPPRTRLVYATSGAPIASSGSMRDSVVLTALSGDLEVGLGLGSDLDGDPVGAGSSAIRQAARELDLAPQELPTRSTVGIVIDDASRQRKEEFLLGILDANPALTLVGGGAGDGWPPGPSSLGVVGIDGQIGAGAGLVALVRTGASWKTFRHHAYQPTGETLKVTKVDDSCLRVREIGGMPAAQAYAERIGVAVKDLEFGKPGGFSKHPTAMRVGREYFLCAPWSPLPDGSILFAHRILPNTELEIMKQVDVVDALEQFVQAEIPRELPDATCALYFNCYGRYQQARNLGIEEELEARYARGPRAAGMNAVFAIFKGFQVNSTLTAIAFGPGR